MPAEHATPEWQIRLLREDDLADYKGLRDLMLARHPDAFTSDAETELRRTADSYRSRLSGGNSGLNLFTLSAWQGASLVGALSCEREPRAKVRHIAHIVGMMVIDELHGRGIGRALMDAALRLLRSEPGLSLATLTVTSSNGAAVKLYGRCGFIRYGRLEGALQLPGGSLLDKDLMSCKL
jgi:ribosomal protein S18 acetylase RimI-like enzyme